MNRLPGIAAVALIVLGGATTSASPGAAGGPPAPIGAATLSAPASSSVPPQMTTPAPEPVRDTEQITIREASVKPVPPSLPGPARIRYPGINADMPARAVGVAADGSMDIPEDAATAGWYRFSAAPSAKAGNTIIAAHAGSIPTPRGPLYDLRASRVGQAIEIVDTTGATSRWKVAKVEQLHKETLNLGPYFMGIGERKLVLFTCGGRWDAERQSYEDNIIVTAIPAG